MAEERKNLYSVNGIATINSIKTTFLSASTGAELTGSLLIRGPISASIVDANTAGSSSVAEFVHDAGTSAAGIAADITFRTSNGAAIITDAASLGGTLTTATNGAEVSALDIRTRSAGSLRRVLRVYGSGGIGIGTQTNLVDPGNGGIVISTTNGLYINSGGVNYTAVGTFGGSNMSFGSGAFNVTLAAFALSISAGQGTILNNGFFSIAAAAGFRRLPVVVNNVAKTVGTSENMICMTNLSAPRTVTLPAATNGIIVRVATDSSATPTNHVIVTGSGNATINGINSYGNIAAANPYGFTEYWCSGSSWFVADTVNKTSNENIIDFLIQRNTSTITETAGDRTVGIRFTPATGSVCQGFRLYWSGSTPRDFEVKLWSGSLGVVSVSVGLTGANDYTGIWSSPVGLNRYHQYYISFREKTGNFYYNITGADTTDFNDSTVPVRVGQNGVIIQRSPYNYAAGNNAPATSGSWGTSVDVAPIFPLVAF